MISSLLWGFQFAVFQNRIVYTLSHFKRPIIDHRATQVGHMHCSFWTCVFFLCIVLNIILSLAFLWGFGSSQRQSHLRNTSKRTCEARQCPLTWGRPWACCPHYPGVKTSHSLDQMLPLKGSSPALRLHANCLDSFVTRCYLGPRRPWDNFESSVSSGCGQKFTPRSRS